MSYWISSPRKETQQTWNEIKFELSFGRTKNILRKAKKFVNQNNNIDSLYSDLKCDSVKLANRVQGKSSYYTDIHKVKNKNENGFIRI